MGAHTALKLMPASESSALTCSVGIERAKVGMERRTSYKHTRTHTRTHTHTHTHIRTHTDTRQGEKEMKDGVSVYGAVDETRWPTSELDEHIISLYGITVW